MSYGRRFLPKSPNAGAITRDIGRVPYHSRAEGAGLDGSHIDDLPTYTLRWIANWLANFRIMNRRADSILPR